MKLLICADFLLLLLLLLATGAAGMYFELPESNATEGSDDFMGDVVNELSEWLPVNQLERNLTAQDNSLALATDTLDALWQQFRQGLSSLIDSVSHHDYGEFDKPTATTSEQASNATTKKSAAMAKH
ncbi:maker164 [Drosophila busckii]|uniref:Maker164 n=1 Tax=Drosophila busckii TaxID=30019 RepID=A0A0M4EM88_DROBS|nr:uncharacterized protein LOC108602723 [Drosophila busckii]ALC45564.1 maker164 [Drosophila busckii]